MRIFLRFCFLFGLISIAHVDAAEPPANAVPPPPGMKIIRTPFRLEFLQYDGDPKKPETLLFPIHTIDLKQPTSSLKLGELIPSTKLRLQAFKYILLKSPPFADDSEDMSELTLVNVETKETYTLVHGKIIDIPKTQIVPEVGHK